MMRCVAIDLGAESCRVSLVEAAEGRMHTRLVHRFANGPVERGGHLYWNLARILDGVTDGLRMCAAEATGPIGSIGVDGWAVDYVRIDDRGRAIDDPFCYRDTRTESAMEEVWERISPERLYQITGIQFLRFNTLYQLFADKRDGVAQGQGWLTIPEYILHSLGAPAIAEYTNATHTQLVDARRRGWSDEIFAASGLDRGAAPPIVPPGSLLGELRGKLSDLSAFRDTQLIAPACHDTGSAVAGIPAVGPGWAFLSSGTWSLVGTLLDHPCLTQEAQRYSVSNEGHIGGTIRFLKNVNGMWLLEECLRHWGTLGYDWDAAQLADACEKDLWEKQRHVGKSINVVLVDEGIETFTVDAEQLLLPGDMPARINHEIVRCGGKPLPIVNRMDPQAFEKARHVAQTIFVNLARRYAEVLKLIAAISGAEFNTIYVVGGGSRNHYLNLMLARAANIAVDLGGTESATNGNAAVQFAALENRAAGKGRKLACGAMDTCISSTDVARWASHWTRGR